MGHDPYEDQKSERRCKLRKDREWHTAKTVRLSTRLQELNQQIDELETERKQLRNELDEHQGKWPT